MASPETPRPQVICQELGPLAKEDFYIDEGVLVFTEVGHLKRGYCCREGHDNTKRPRCRHCPYGID